MTFADLDNQLLLQGPALARLTAEEFYDLCQHNQPCAWSAPPTTTSLPCPLPVQK